MRCMICFVLIPASSVLIDLHHMRDVNVIAGEHNARTEETAKNKHRREVLFSSSCCLGCLTRFSMLSMCLAYGTNTRIVSWHMYPCELFIREWYFIWYCHAGFLPHHADLHACVLLLPLRGPRGLLWRVRLLLCRQGMPVHTKYPFLFLNVL
jgi:hypothetical protein